MYSNLTCGACTVAEAFWTSNPLIYSNTPENLRVLTDSILL